MEGGIMPKGEPSKNTIRVDRYQKRVGYKVKSFKLKGDVAEQFAAACEKAGVSQAAKITELMQGFIDETEKR